MQVALRLVLRSEPAAADAFLLFAETAAPLVEACVRLGGQSPPAVFPVRGGFVLVPESRESRHVPGAIRLRRLAGDLFIPADADLIPALLPDEATALTQNRGLVVLPGGDVLAFDPEPLPVRKWLAPRGVRREVWRSFPARPQRPDTLSVIERPSPPAALLEILGGGAPDDANPLAGAGSGEGVPEDARPSAGSRSAVGRFVAGTGLAVGSFLTWVGKQIGSSGLAKFGGDLARRAIEAVPRLSERVLGEQEAALREVLRQLQSGDIEKGLRRAPIAVADPNQPARIGMNANLGSRDPRYSLRDLIGSGGGRATAWLGGGDIWNELAREYRRLAEEATKRGDFRRAAYLYGVLLRDLRSAANVLMAGGLCRDAALLYRDKLNDPLAAADAFERAGDHDEALRLFEKYEHFEKAAELCRRLGDEDRAIAFYVRAADVLAKRGHLLGAGDLIRTKAGRRDLAIGYFRRGWEGITAENVACGQRLLDEHLVAEDLPAVKSLLLEAEGSLGERVSDAGQFFNYALNVSDGFLPTEIRDDLSDRVRLMFAAHLRTAGPGLEGTRLANELFGRDNPWPGPVVRDAGFAASRKDRPKPPAARTTHPHAVKLAEGTVTAVGVARGTHDVVVATTEAVVLWRVTENRIVPVCQVQGERVIGLSVDPKGQVVYTLHSLGGSVKLRSHLADGSTSYQRIGEISREVGGEDAAFVQPEVQASTNGFRVVLETKGQREGFSSLLLNPATTSPFAPEGSGTCFLVESAEGLAWELVQRRVWRQPSRDRRGFDETPAPWRPAVPEANPLAHPPIDYINPGGGSLVIAGVDSAGHLHCAKFTYTKEGDIQRWQACTIHGGFVAVCFTGEGTVAAVTSRNEVQWLRVVGSTLEVSATVKLDVPTVAVAIVARPGENEVVVILADGYAIRVRRP